MSHAATNWAIEQRGLKPATKLLLWYLCDCHNPDVGCFPSQELLATRAEMSRSTVNLHLNKLEELGLIKRVASRDFATNRQLPTQYILAFEYDFTAEKAVSDNCKQDAKAVSENEQKPCPKNDESRVLNSDTNPVREPVNITSNKKTNKKSSCFEQFWDAFADKRGREGAERVWNRKRLDNMADEVIAGAVRYTKTRGDNRQYWKQAQGWLNDGRWNDEPSSGQSGKTQTSLENLSPLEKLRLETMGAAS